MTVFGHPVLFDCLEIREDTASEKTPMQWHSTRTLNLDNTLGFSIGQGRRKIEVALFGVSKLGFPQNQANFIGI